MLRNRLRSRIFWLLALAVLTVGAGFAYGAIPDGSGTIHGCYGKSGQLRVIDPAAADCRRNETPITWGSSATSTYNVRSGTTIGAGSAAQAFCLPGEMVTGGGGLSVPNDAGLTQNHPISDSSGLIANGTNAIGWQVASEGFGRVQAYVVCAS